MKTKRPPSTADRLGTFREQLVRHYKSLRSEKCHPFPKPSIDQFAVWHQGMAKTIEAEELKNHNDALRRAEEMKALNK